MSNKNKKCVLKLKRVEKENKAKKYFLIPSCFTMKNYFWFRTTNHQQHFFVQLIEVFWLRPFQCCHLGSEGKLDSDLCSCAATRFSERELSDVGTELPGCVLNYCFPKHHCMGNKEGREAVTMPLCVLPISRNSTAGPRLWHCFHTLPSTPPSQAFITKGCSKGSSCHVPGFCGFLPLSGILQSIMGNGNFLLWRSAVKRYSFSCSFQTLKITALLLL